VLRIESLSITLGEFSVEDVSLEIGSNEYFIILGPTGAGKTVLLETIAGIYTPDKGRIFLGDREITSTELRSRNIGMVYQDYMLFPHLTVRDNIAFGLRQRKIPWTNNMRWWKKCAPCWKSNTSPRGIRVR